MRFQRCGQAFFLGAVLCFMSLGCSQGDTAKIVPPPRITLAAGQKVTVAQAGGAPAKKSPEKEKTPDEKSDSSTKAGDKTSAGEAGKKTPDKP